MLLNYMFLIFNNWNKYLLYMQWYVKYLNKKHLILQYYNITILNASYLNIYLNTHIKFKN